MSTNITHLLNSRTFKISYSTSTTYPMISACDSHTQIVLGNLLLAICLFSYLNYLDVNFHFYHAKAGSLSEFTMSCFCSYIVEWHFLKCNQSPERGLMHKRRIQSFWLQQPVQTHQEKLPDIQWILVCPPLLAALYGILPDIWKTPEKHPTSELEFSKNLKTEERFIQDGV